MRTESITKKDRVYLTSKTYLSKVKLGCASLLFLSVASVASILFVSGLSIASIVASGAVFGVCLLACRYLFRQSSEASFKGGNLILTNLRNRSVVAPVGSIRRVKSGGVLGVKYTRVSYKLDGCANSFLILGKESTRTPEEIIREEMANVRKEKKMANHKPGSVLTQSA